SAHRRVDPKLEGDEGNQDEEEMVRLEPATPDVLQGGRIDQVEGAYHDDDKHHRRDKHLDANQLRPRHFAHQRMIEVASGADLTFATLMPRLPHANVISKAPLASILLVVL